MTPQLEKFIDAIYNEIKSDPELSYCSEFQVKATILEAVRAYGEEIADTMVAVHVLSAQMRALAVLAQYT